MRDLFLDDVDEEYVDKLRARFFTPEIDALARDKNLTRETAEIRYLLRYIAWLDSPPYSPDNV